MVMLYQEASFSMHLFLSVKFLLMVASLENHCLYLDPNVTESILVCARKIFHGVLAFIYKGCPNLKEIC